MCVCARLHMVVIARICSRVMGKEGEKRANGAEMYLLLCGQCFVLIGPKNRRSKSTEQALVESMALEEKTACTFNMPDAVA